MPVASAADFVDLLRQNDLVELSRLDEIMREVGVDDTLALVKFLVKQGWLTRYQVQEVWRGRGAALVLGPYRLLDKLGEGGMGQVFKARHQIMQRLVALKIMRPELLKNPDAPRRFLREAQAAARLSHPNIVTLYDAGEINDTHYLAMELIDGIDLGRCVRESGRLPVAQACDYLQQVAAGLSHAHAQGLVHRDIKPSNLLVGKANGVVKILDMGLARLSTPSILTDTSGTLTREGSVLGTFDYLAPEQAKNAREVDARADLYSLGCTFYHLIGGKPPFADGAGLDKLIRHQMDEPPSLASLRPDAPPSIAALIHRLMAKRPEDRYQTANDVVDAVQRLNQCEATEQVIDLPIDAIVPAPETPPQERRAVSRTTPLPEPRQNSSIPSAAPRVAQRRGRGIPKFVWFIAGGGTGMAALVLLVVLLAALGNKTPKETAGVPPTEAATPSVTILPLEKYLSEETVMATGFNTRAWLSRSVVKHQFGESLKQNLLNDAQARPVLDALGINPWDDVDRLILAWEGRRLDKPLLLVRGRFRPAKIRNAFGMRVHDLTPGRGPGHKLYEYQPDPMQPPTFLALLNENTLASSSDAAVVRDALERAGKGAAPPLENKAMRELLGVVNPKHDLWIVALGGTLAQMCDASPNLFIKTNGRDVFRSTDTLSGGMTFGEDIQLDLDFTARDADLARVLYKQLDDSRKFIKLLLAVFGNNQKDAILWKQALEGGKLINNGTVVHLHAHVSAAEIDKAMKR
jgi:eukaryotic-like serine/threonine-protein kinase